MNYDKIIEDIRKYNYYVITNKKTILLASNNLLKDAKKKTLDKIKSKLNVFKGIDIIRFKITKINKNIYEKSKTAKLTSIGGPISVTIDFFEVSDKGKLKSDNQEDRNDIVYITEKYLEKNKIKSGDLKKIAKKAYLNQLRKTVLSVVTIDKLLKK